MIIKRQSLFSKKRNKLYPIVGGYNVNTKEDNLDFDRELDEKLKKDKVSKKLGQTALPATLGFIIGTANKKAVGKSALIGGTIGGVAGYGLGEVYDHIKKFDEKQREAKSKILEGYKKLDSKGYKGQEERERYRRKYLDSSKNLSNIKL